MSAAWAPAAAEVPGLGGGAPNQLSVVLLELYCLGNCLTQTLTDCPIRIQSLSRCYLTGYYFHHYCFQNSNQIQSRSWGCALPSPNALGKAPNHIHTETP